MPPSSTNDPLHKPLPVGKLPPYLLEGILSKAPIFDKRVLLGPGLGLDCAIIDNGENLLVFKSDPITFATDQIGWYAVQVCVNDIATTGALPRWFLATLLLPEGKTDAHMVEQISQQLFSACREMEISLIGGHTEITFGIDRPILAGTLVGEVARQKLVTPHGISAGDHILLTKSIPIEGTAILAREVPQLLLPVIGEEGLQQAADYLYQPGISVLKDAQTAVQSGQVTGMHDPTEGGLKTALWEMSMACEKSLHVNLDLVPISPLSRRICLALDLDPLGVIASGSLLIAAAPMDAAHICQALIEKGITCTDIGQVVDGAPGVLNLAGGVPIPVYPAERDEICKILEG